MNIDTTKDSAMTRAKIFLFSLMTLTTGANAATFSGSFAQVAAGGGLTTTIVLVNTGATAAPTHIAFSGDDGTPLSLPLTVTQAGIRTNASSVDQNIQAGATVLIEVTEPEDRSTKAGRAVVTSDGSIDGLLIYHFTSGAQEIVVPLETRQAQNYYFQFPSAALEASTGVAIANLTPQTVNVTARIRGLLGIVGPNLGTITIPGNGHTAFILDQQFPILRSLSGLLELATPNAGQISVTALGFSPRAYLALPLLVGTNPSNSRVPHIAMGSGVASSIALVNLASTTLSATANLTGDDGSPLSTSIDVIGATCSPRVIPAAVSVSIAAPPDATCAMGFVSTAASPSVGSALITTDSMAVSWVLYSVRGTTVRVPVEIRNAQSYILPFDHTAGQVTGVGISSTVQQTSSVVVTIRNEDGTPSRFDQIDLAPNGHVSFVLADRFPTTATKRGTIEFAGSTPGAIGAVGLRFTPSGGISNVPLFVH